MKLPNIVTVQNKANDFANQYVLDHASSLVKGLDEETFNRIVNTIMQGLVDDYCEAYTQGWIDAQKVAS